MQAGPSNAVVPSQAKKRSRVPPAGVTIMEGIIKHHGIMHALILAFSEFLNAHGNSPTWQDHPSLSPKSLKNLSALARDTPYPTQNLIKTWAELLNAAPEDVSTWLAEYRSPIHHLPTPVSTSPEPTQFQHWHPSRLKTDPIISPVIPSRTMATPAPEPSIHPDHELIDAIAEALRSEDSGSTSPSTLEEFEAMFMSYQDRIKVIIDHNEEYLCS
ncbi:hypothetical protein C0991_003645 [Blastosporella zonata]|nr:hypothetical protein C0991_003645 [Blastosporella zonata]